MGIRNFRNGAATTLTAPVDNVSTSITVSAITGFPVQFPYTLILDPNTTLEEVVDATAAVGATITIVRGVDSTTSSAHSAGAVVWHGISARDHAEANSHVNAASNVHGSSGALVDIATPQTITADKTFTGQLQTGGGPVVAVGGAQTISGAKTFSGGLSTSAGGAVVDVGTNQTVTGNKTLNGTTILNGPTTLAGVTTHSGDETHSGQFVHNGAIAFTVAAFNQLGSPTVYTPAWTASTAPSIGNGTLTGNYFQLGKLVFVWISVIFGTGTNAGAGTWSFGLPPGLPRNATIAHIGTGKVFQNGVTNRAALPFAAANTIQVAVDGFASPASSTVPHSWASSDQLQILYVYPTT